MENQVVGGWVVCGAGKLLVWARGAATDSAAPCSVLHDSLRACWLRTSRPSDSLFIISQHHRSSCLPYLDKLWGRSVQIGTRQEEC